MTAIIMCAVAAIVFVAVPVSGGITAVHQFAGGTQDPRWPEGTPIIDGTVLYATTFAGGTYGDGTVFRVNTDGTGFTVLHEFEGDDYDPANNPDDGRLPGTRLALGGGTLYGTTSQGGNNHDGTLFKVNTNGSGYSVLHHFDRYSSGRTPHGGVTLNGGALYGTTLYGQGYSGNGNIYKINTDGSGFTQIQSFPFPGNDGTFPRSDVVISGNTVYATASAGGPGVYDVFGAVVKVNTDGTGSAVIHAFTGGANDGRAPYYGAMTLDGSVLYGMTVRGGDDDKGTVFKVNTDGTGFSLLHEFGATSDGALPYGQPTLVGNTLYGMTYGGGAHDKGTVFKVNTAGTGYSVLHDFSGADGANPYESFALQGASLYGTATYGGSTGVDGGVIFKLDPLSMASLAVGSGTVSFSDNGLAAGGYSAQGLPGGTLPSTVELQNLVLSSGMATLKVLYSPTVLIDAGIDEATFRLYWYDTSTSQWLLAGRNSNNTQITGSFVLGTPTGILGDWGIDMGNNYVWANIDHASTYGMAGVLVACPSADLTNDCFVDFEDFAKLAAQYGMSGAPAACPSADLTNDCVVDFEDLAKLAAQWLTGSQ